MRPALALAVAALAGAPLAAQSATPLPAIEGTAGAWKTMFEGVAFAQYDRQNGSRGARQAGSLNWGMFMASRDLGAGELQLRTMLSLDALGVGASGYPLLLQTGEEYRGQPLHDRQHPHDAFMELGASYRGRWSDSAGFSLYAAPVGEPALGPVAFIMRPSAMDNPIAPIGHHWQDATHVSFGVLTAGIFSGSWKLDASWFNGREPDDQRWNFDPIRLDSWAGRISFAPDASWSASASYGYLNSPEASAPGVSEHRATVSIAHGVAIGSEGEWSSTLIWGGNGRDGASLSNSGLFESEYSRDGRNSFIARGEYVQKTAAELAVTPPPLGLPASHLFDVGEITLGYVREFATWRTGTVGAGVLGTMNFVPAALQPEYGSATPIGVVFFVRMRPRRTTMAPMNHM
ncbi:MAG TPA: hypothetical protein VGI97_07600 [Gemmatimonadaceae bacterium]|jgi:hypothetical protein